MVYVIILILNVFSAVTVNCNTFQWNNNDDTLQWQRSASSIVSSVPICVDIPTNLTLCQGIGYMKMRLPNLLNHDTLTEVTQQATSWVPLYQLNCHPDTQLFLCSLFSPVCLDHPIPPCRSLCQSVQASCEKVMLKYGYPWPSIVQCGQFPIDNDMCIMAQHSTMHKETNINDKNEERLHKNHKSPNHRKKDQQLKRRRGNGISGSSDAILMNGNVETVFEPQPGHLQQQQLEARLKHEPQVDRPTQEPVPTMAAEIGPNHRQRGKNRNANRDKQSNNNQKQLFNDIVEKSCVSQWILKARIHEPNPQTKHIKIRSFRVLRGNIDTQQSPLMVSVTPNITDALMQTPVEGPQQTQPRRRYLILGITETTGNSMKYTAVYAIPWPHKSAQLRKALKAIKNGDVQCGNGHEKPAESTIINPNEEHKTDSIDGNGNGNDNGNDKKKREPKNRNRKRQKD